MLNAARCKRNWDAGTFQQKTDRLLKNSAIRNHSSNSVVEKNPDTPTETQPRAIARSAGGLLPGGLPALSKSVLMRFLVEIPGADTGSLADIIKKAIKSLRNAKS